MSDRDQDWFREKQNRLNGFSLAYGRAMIDALADAMAGSGEFDRETAVRELIDKPYAEMELRYREIFGPAAELTIKLDPLSPADRVLARIAAGKNQPQTAPEFFLPPGFSRLDDEFAKMVSDVNRLGMGTLDRRANGTPFGARR